MGKKIVAGLKHVLKRRQTLLSTSFRKKLATKAGYNEIAIAQFTKNFSLEVIRSEPQQLRETMKAELKRLQNAHL